jgi:hypothetical protein
MNCEQRTSAAHIFIKEKHTLTLVRDLKLSYRYYAAQDSSSVRSREEKTRAEYQRTVCIQPATKSCAQRQKKAEGEPADDDLSSGAAKGQHFEVGIEPLKDQQARAGWTREDSGLSSAGGGCHEEDNNIRKVLLMRVVNIKNNRIIFNRVKGPNKLFIPGCRIT